MRMLTCDADVDVLLRDGDVVHIRCLRDSDAGALRELYDAVSEDTLYLRFFIVSKLVVAREIQALTRHADDQHASLVGVVGGRIVGVATFERQRADEQLAEIAFLVGDDYHGKGVGTALLQRLAVLAARFGIERFVAETLANNARMLHLLSDAGFPLTTTCGQDVVRVEFPLRPVPA